MTSPLITVVALTMLFLLLSTPVRSFGWQTTSDDSHASRKEVHSALELAQAPTSVPACDVGTVSFTLLPGPRTCALPFEAYLVTNDPRVECPLSATKLTICDEFEQHCTTCTQNSQTALGILFTCLPLNSAGIQIVIANFSFGSLQNQQLAESDTFICPPPPNCPTNNIGIGLSSIHCGQPFQAFVNEGIPLPACRLSVSVFGFMLGGPAYPLGCDTETIVSAVPKRIILACHGPVFSGSGLARMRELWSYGNSSAQENFLYGVQGSCPSPSSPPTAPPVVPPTAPISLPVAPSSSPSFAQCDSSTIQLNILPGPRQCGQNFQALLSSAVVAGCGLSSSSLSVCDAYRANCVQCTNPAVMSEGFRFDCLPINFNGFQVITANYSYGQLQGVISTSDEFSCPPPPEYPIPPSLACDSSTVEFNLLPGPRQCGQNFQALLNTTVTVPGCLLFSSGLSVCDANRANCVQCTTQETTSEGIQFNCPPINYNGFQVITANYGLGGLYGVISTSDSFTCPPPPML